MTDQTDGGPNGRSRTAGIDLYWLPLGAGGHSVRWNGRIYEAASALIEWRTACALFHSALVVSLPPVRWVIEMTPVWAAGGRDRGVVGEGAVGARWAARSKLFRYEVRCWRDGSIADIAEAVDSPRRLTSDESRCRRLLALIASVPTPVWGRDELGAGEMWNSNSVTSWALARCGLDALGLTPPEGGRAPGWYAGIVAAYRPLHENATQSGRIGTSGPTSSGPMALLPAAGDPVSWEDGPWSPQPRVVKRQPDSGP